MRKLLFILFLLPFLAASQCACVWMDATGVMRCQVYTNCGNPNFQDCRNKVTSSSLWCASCPIPPGQSCNPCTYNTVANGACWYQGAGCSASVVCNYVLSLPVELINLKVYNDGDENVISWQTASEYNSSHFRIEYSSDGVNYISLALIPAAQNSTEVIDYVTRHIDYEKKINYYKFFQVDMDGAEKYYGELSINNLENSEKIIKFTNLLGQIVDESFVGLVLVYFENGEIRKIWKED